MPTKTKDAQVKISRYVGLESKFSFMKKERSPFKMYL